MKKTVVLGFAGTQMDGGQGVKRWEKWRPSVSLAQHEDLVVDRFELWYSGSHDELAMRLKADIEQISPQTTVRPHKLPITDPWDFENVYATLFDFMRDYPFDPENEDYLVHITTGSHTQQICLFLLVGSNHIPGRILQTAPPRQSLSDAPCRYEVIDLDMSKYDQIAQRFARVQEKAVAHLKSGIPTRNDRFNAMISEIERVAIRSKAPILLSGPTGAGKSQLAQRIYELKKERHNLTGRFVDVNCATLGGDGASSALFGHVKGAFTGAVGDRPGLLRAANKGILFLDEIGELGLDEQAMLLKAIEEKRFLPVGGDQEVTSDFQLIAGTNKNLAEEVAAGRFRRDLFARINLWTYTLPSLAERSEDIGPNIEYQLMLFSAENGYVARFNKEARELYMTFAGSAQASWSGNFRDLGASVTRMATLAEGGRITLSVVEQEIERLQQLWQAEARPVASTGEVSLSDFLSGEEIEAIDPFDAMQLVSVLGVCRTSKSLSDAGRKLYAVSRLSKSKSNDADRLKKYLAKFGLSWDDIEK